MNDKDKQIVRDIANKAAEMSLAAHLHRHPQEFECPYCDKTTLVIEVLSKTQTVRVQSVDVMLYSSNIPREHALHCLTCGKNFIKKEIKSVYVEDNESN